MLNYIKRVCGGSFVHFLCRSRRCSLFIQIKSIGSSSQFRHRWHATLKKTNIFGWHIFYVGERGFWQQLCGTGHEDLLIDDHNLIHEQLDLRFAELRCSGLTVKFDYFKASCSVDPVSSFSFGVVECLVSGFDQLPLVSCVCRV